jgi:hypothetical protein
MCEHSYRRHEVALGVRVAPWKIENGRQTVLGKAPLPSRPLALGAKGAAMVILAAAADAAASIVEYWKLAVCVVGLVVAADVIARFF